VTSPYRAATCYEVYEAPTREGLARLEVAPRHTRLEVDERVQVSVTDRFVVLSGRHLARRRSRSLRLEGARLLVARGVPAEEVGIWYEGTPGVVARIFGVRPPELLDSKALSAWDKLDRLVQRLRAALLPHRGGAESASEFGQGADRVLLADDGDRYVLYVRRLFRERPRRALEVCRGGTVIFPHRKAEARIRCESRFGVTVLGDNILFSNPEGMEIGRIWLPWISPQDRAELARRFGERLHRRAP